MRDTYKSYLGTSEIENPNFILSIIDTLSNFSVFPDYCPKHNTNDMISIIPIRYKKTSSSLCTTCAPKMAKSPHTFPQFYGCLRCNRGTLRKMMQKCKDILHIISFHKGILPAVHYIW